MATFPALYSRIYFGHIDVTALADNIDFGPLNVAKVPFPNFAAGGYVENKPGLISGDYALSLLQDYATGILDDQLTLTTLKNQWPITVLPNVTNTEAAGDPALFSRAIISTANRGGSIGAAEKAPLSGSFDTALGRGLLGHPKAARTANGTGTAIAQAGPTSTQKLYAVLHVFAYSGFTNVVFKVQSDDASGFPSATDRLTFTTVTGTTSEFSSVAGGWNTETHLRSSWTVTGSGSVTFAMAFAVL